MKYYLRNFVRISTAIILCFNLSACITEQSTTNLELISEHKWSADKIDNLKQFILPDNFLLPDSNTNNSFLSNKSAAILGGNIFFDKSFSANNQISCASCHKPEQYFTDGLKTAKGILPTSRNTPTIVGVSKNQWFFHDGRSDSLWSQALGPLENAKEHGATRSFYAHNLFKNKELKVKYENIFGNLPDITNLKRFPLNAGPVKDLKPNKAWMDMADEDKQIITNIFVNIGKSIATYEQYLKPSKSRVDYYIEHLVDGKPQLLNETLSANEARGLRLFTGKANCTICHFGSTYSDSEFHNIATVGIENKPYDWGRYNGVKELLKSEFNCRSKYNDSNNKQCDELKYISLDSHEAMASFKTPSLRNVSKTSPYMHDGQFADLASVVAHYDNADKLILGKKDLLPVTLTKQNQSDLVAFLKALDSDIQPIPNWLKTPK